MADFGDNNSILQKFDENIVKIPAEGFVSIAEACIFETHSLLDSIANAEMPKEHYE